MYLVAKKALPLPPSPPIDVIAKLSKMAETQRPKSSHNSLLDMMITTSPPSSSSFSALPHW